MSSFPSSHHLYHCDAALSHYQTSVIAAGEDERGHYLIFNQTIFRPEGGGQPADRGVITSNICHFPLLDLAFDEKGRVKHYIRSKKPYQGHIFLTLDMLWRHQLSQWHTAGHLIASILQLRDPTLKNFQHIHTPGKGRMLFQCCSMYRKHPNALKKSVQKQMEAACKEARPVLIRHAKQKRIVQIEGFSPYPCTGTHVTTTAILRPIAIQTIEVQKDLLVITYDLCS